MTNISYFSYICPDKRKDKTLTNMKRILSIVCIAATAWLLTACGSVIQLPRNGMNGGIKTYTFYNLPENLQDLQSLPEANLKDPYGVAALTIAALCRYETNPDACFEMLNWLKANRKALNAGKMKAERVEKFSKLLEMTEQYRRKNQYE